MISAAYANPTWNEKGNTDKMGAYLQGLNDHFDKAIEMVDYPEGIEPEVNWKNPFYAAAKRGLEKSRQKYAKMLEGKTLGEVVSPKDKEQMEARERGRQAIDQMVT